MRYQQSQAASRVELRNSPTVPSPDKCDRPWLARGIERRRKVRSSASGSSVTNGDDCRRIDEHQ
ncbi:hypothetical protein MES5069_520118 [Mesorhizobium escarrei]|uniref:Uncharacterized protein n=1 Tax=Mesorhizobium escarrei TaxID=666018 RepID=A0ABN8K815_9HYPH|nr:hypothetical protein MES5069_520118 [Mesorhizobium escarrei]